MCRICSSCGSIMNYDPHFEAEVCVKCGKMIRKRGKNKKVVIGQTQRIETIRQIFGVVALH